MSWIVHWKYHTHTQNAIMLQQTLIIWFIKQFHCYGTKGLNSIMT